MSYIMCELCFSKSVFVVILLVCFVFVREQCGREGGKVVKGQGQRTEVNKSEAWNIYLINQRSCPLGLVGIGSQQKQTLHHDAVILIAGSL